MEGPTPISSYVKFLRKFRQDAPTEYATVCRYCLQDRVCYHAPEIRSYCPDFYQDIRTLEDGMAAIDQQLIDEGYDLLSLPWHQRIVTIFNNEDGDQPRRIPRQIAENVLAYLETV